MNHEYLIVRKNYNNPKIINKIKYSFNLFTHLFTVIITLSVCLLFMSKNSSCICKDITALISHEKSRGKHCMHEQTSTRLYISLGFTSN